MTAQQIASLACRYRALQREGELAQLIEILLARRPKVVVEIGTCHGGTLRAWCECATDDALLISVDMPGGEFGGGYDDWQGGQIARHRRAGQQLILLRGDSHDADTHRRVLETLAGRTIDFLFIDGDHTYEGVRADFEDYAPFVSQAGIVALHDVVPYPEDPRCQADRYWRELRKAYQGSRQIRTEGGYLGCGIGVVWPNA